MTLWNTYKKLWVWPIEKLASLGKSEDVDTDVDTTSFPIGVITPRNDLFAELTVPTQKEGATFSQRGWNIGGDMISRTTSSGTIEENPYEDSVARLRILEDEIEIGVMLETGYQTLGKVIEGESPNRTIRISMARITDIREEQIGENPGIVFETAEDVYQIGLQANNGVLSLSNKFDGRWVGLLVQRIQEQIDQHETSSDDGEVDVVGQLERLKNLHDEGALTDEEFQRKKSKLLEEV